FWTFGVAAAVFSIDRATKWLIETKVSVMDSYTIIPGFFDIVHSQNRGVAFGLFHEGASAARTLLLGGLSLVAILVIAGMLWRTGQMDNRTAWGLALILGGAAGNVFDRLMWGRVTDFLELYVRDFHWPTFTMADTAIVVGSGLLLIDLFKPRREAART